MRRIHYYIATFIVFTFLGNLVAQAQTTLERQLEGKSTLKQIMATVDDYYQDKPLDWRGVEGNDRRLKHWKRWEWYMSGRLGENGEFVNIPARLNKADRQVDKMESVPTRNPNSFWTSEGPVTTDDVGIGRADRIAFHPNDPDIIYVGTPSGGLWKTTDGGTIWFPLTDNLPSMGISGICVSPDNPNEIFILTGDADSDYILGGLVGQMGYVRQTAGVFRSLDGGTTWQFRGDVYGSSHLAFKMVQQPTDPHVLLVATDKGVYRTENAGLTWSQTRSGVFHDVEFLPGTQFAVAAGKTEVVYSLSGGSAWAVSTLDVPLNNPKRVEIEVTPDYSTGVYLLAGGVSADSTYHGTYWSSNSGLSFTQVNTVPNILGIQPDGGGNRNQSDYDLSMAVSPTDHDKVITGAVNIWRSPNGGNDYYFPTTATHSDIHDMAYNPLDGIVYACTDGGVYRSLDDGDTWQSLWIGFATGQMYHMRGTPLNNDDFLAGFQDNGIKIRVAGTYWENIIGADGFDVAFYPTDATKFYTTLDLRMFRMDGTFDDITPDPNSNGLKEWFGTVGPHVSDPQIVFAGYSDVFKSVDNGDSWDNIGGSGSWAIAMCPSNPGRFYSAGEDGYGNSEDYLPELYRFDDGGDTRTAIHDYAPFLESGVKKITDIAVNPNNSNQVYVTIGGFNASKKVYRSVDAGETWTNWTSNLPNIPINCIAVAGDGTSVYLGTDLGVFYRGSGMTGWMVFRNGLPKIPVTDIYIQNNAGRVFAGTFGRGMWSADLVGDCPGSLVTSGTISGFVHFQATQQISATNTIERGADNEFHLTAGNAVVLKPGFAANRTTFFTAAIDGCPSSRATGSD